MKSVLFVSTHDNSPEYTKRDDILNHLAEIVRSDEITTDTVMFEQLEFMIFGNEASIVNTKNGKDLAEYDLVYVKNWKAHEGAASALAVYLSKKGVTFICSELKHFRATDKIAESFVLAMNGIPYPDTLFTVHSDALLGSVMRHVDDFPYPLIVKAVNGSAGEDNYLVRDEARLKQVIDENPNLSFMIQNFVQNDGDHRIVLLNFVPKLSFKRTRQNEDTHLNNTSQGGTATKTEISEYDEQVLADSIKAAQLLEREVAGVDVLFDQATGKHVILETNASPQLSTGAFLDEKSVIFRDFIHDLLR
jgi:RimK family alpha-L-glutamate ligase